MRVVCGKWTKSWSWTGTSWRSPGLRYKVDTNHDSVYLEFDEPTLSVREIRAIFLNLGLQPLFIGLIPTELRSRTKTERLSVGTAIGDQ